MAGVKTCWVTHCNEPAYDYRGVHGSTYEEDVEFATCDDKNHKRDAQKALRRCIRRERGVVQPKKNKHGYKHRHKRRAKDGVESPQP